MQEGNGAKIVAGHLWNHVICDWPNKIIVNSFCVENNDSRLFRLAGAVLECAERAQNLPLVNHKSPVYVVIILKNMN